MNDVIANHLANPVVSPRFRHVSDQDALKAHAIDFFCAGSGGVETLFRARHADGARRHEH
jgi:hemoglobin